MTGPDPLVRVERLSVRRRRALLLDDVDLALGTGAHALIGPNGAGKTTLLRVLATATAATEGSVALLGRDPCVPAQRLEIRRRLGYLPQEFGVFRRYTVREFLEYAAWLRELPGRRIAGAVAEAAESLDLGDRLEQRLGTLSGGTKQRVGIAQAIVNSPALLLLDEPSTGLDPGQRAGFHRLLTRLKTSACVVLSTHLGEDVRAVCDGATILRAGRVAFHGSLGELATAGGYEGVMTRHAGPR